VLVILEFLFSVWVNPIASQTFVPLILKVDGEWQISIEKSMLINRHIYKCKLKFFCFTAE